MKTTHDGTRLHLSLNVRSLGDSVAFYRDLLGVEPDKLYERFARFTPDEPPLVLSLVDRREPTDGPQRLSHLGLRLGAQTELDAARRRLRTAGRELREEPESRCCYALQTKLWVVDPDGNEWELYRLLEDLQTAGEDSRTCCD
jgi:catechol 2,3-dioxygenase-like lactoylglutathione lyase family enzyme